MHLESFLALSFIQQRTLVLAKYVRDELERFHGIPNDYLPQWRMSEFNVALRYAIYDFLVNDADSDDPFDDEWVEMLSGELLHSVREFWDRYIPDEQKTSFYFAIQEAVVEFLDEFPDVLTEDALYRLIVSIPDYWEVPGRDKRPVFASS